MTAEVCERIAADRSKRTAERAVQWNGVRRRKWDTRLAALALRTPKRRTGSYFITDVSLRSGSHGHEQTRCWWLWSPRSPFDTPLDERWLNTAESLQPIPVWRALAAQYPQIGAKMIAWAEKAMVE
jgi:hypothetical protein